MSIVTNPLRVILMLALLIAVTGCASDVANRYYGGVRYPPKRPNQVEILRRRPDRNFTVIADFQSRGETVAAMQEKAAQIGADAVIISILGGFAGAGADLREEPVAADRSTNIYSHITGTAIIYN